MMTSFKKKLKNPRKTYILQEDNASGVQVGDIEQIIV